MTNRKATQQSIQQEGRARSPESTGAAGAAGADTQELVKQLQKMNVLLDREVSLLQVFIRGVIGGVGSVVGATIVAGFVVAVIAWAVVRLGALPVVGDLIDDQYVTEQLPQL